MIAAAILVLVITLSLAAPVPAADITITTPKGQVEARMVLAVHQNMTNFPSVATSLDASHDANMTRAFSAALKSRDPLASFSSLNLGVKTSASWLNLTVVMSLEGVSKLRGDVAEINMTWLGFNTTTNLRAGSLSYNTVGATYLRHVVDFYQNASRFEDRPNATIQAVTFFVNNQSVSGPTAANQVGNFTVLDFRSLSIPLDNWNRTYSLSNNTTNWRYTPAKLLNATLRIQQSNKTFTLASRYDYSAQITVQGLTLAQGYILRADLGNGVKEGIMAGVVVLALVFAVIVQLSYRRRKKATRLGRR
jgi:hypothetical protein